MSESKYQLQLTGAQIDDALEQMNNRVPEGWTVGERDGVPVPSTSPYYHNNAKYYAEEAAEQAERAESAVPSGTAGAVFFDRAQTLSAAQKAQARENIGAGEGGGSVEPATADPEMDGTAAVGTSAKYAREDHVHPTDTSLASIDAVNTKLNRTTAVTAADTGYTTLKARGISLHTTPTTPSVNGAICLTYE